ncbi:hypothetical protein SAMN05660653_00921 [Desulfonatronum thiosulfatophilum]|uniref:Uncharacterized protein n=1 Tax=Desulfonatronum thiosulfatophilum TaxID=617002 RepID=A0A1G6BDG1_9BACT|nr:hypothetical protein SAMN05660653_00921 [Desulfonatronum thiosulfatophilum]
MYSFPLHSAGPFGNDVDGAWMNASTFLRVLALEGLGWKDIHATYNDDTNNPLAFRGFYNYMLSYLLRKAKHKITKKLRRARTVIGR